MRVWGSRPLRDHLISHHPKAEMVVTGVIKPPPEIRAVCDRTALYVSKNGRAFEQKILSSSKGKTPKFAFLQPDSPFHKYYEERVAFYASGGADEDEKEQETKIEAAKDTKGKETDKETNQAPAEAATLRASFIDPVAQARLLHRKQLQSTPASERQAPPKMQFANIVAPASLSALQLEVIQFTAQMAALDPQKSKFLQALHHREWSNPLFSFLQPRHASFSYFTALTDAYRTVQQRLLGDFKKKGSSLPTEYDYLNKVAYQIEYEHLVRQEQDDDAPAAAVVDWHDFVVVETIDFAIEEKVIEMAPVDEDIRVVSSYQPALKSANATDDYAIDPISGKSVRVSDMPEHMRIQLLDPKWAQERAKFQEKQKESNLVAGEVLADNLRKFAESRGTQLVDAAQSTSKRKAEEPTPAGPSLPAPKKAREVVTTVVAPVTTLPPPPPPSAVTTVPPPPPMKPSAPEDPFASAVSGVAAKVPPEAPRERMSSTDFAASLTSPQVTLLIRIPNDPAQMAWNFFGQVVTLEVDVQSTIKQIKHEVSKSLNGMAVNKIQLKYTPTGAFLNKANETLASLNIGPKASLEMLPKTRGGR